MNETVGALTVSVRVFAATESHEPGHCWNSARAWSREEGEGERLRALVEGRPLIWAPVPKSDGIARNP